MNIRNIAYKLGEIKGQYQKGLADVFSRTGTRPSFTDESAWNTGRYWGASGSGKPKSKEDLVGQYLSWVYICAKLNAETVASIPLRLYVTKSSKAKSYTTVETKVLDKQRKEWLYKNPLIQKALSQSEDVEEVTDHVLLDLLSQVNPIMNSTDLWALTTLYLDITGEAYWYLGTNKKLGVPQEIWPIPSQYINPDFDPKELIKSYTYRLGKTEIIFEPERIIYFTYPNPQNMFTGFSPISGIVDAVYTYNQMYVFEESLFENRANIGGVLEMAENSNVSEMERVKLTWGQDYSGNRRAGKTPILPPGVKFVKSELTPEEMSFIEGRKLTRQEICAAFDIPFGMFDPSATRANADAAAYQHAKNGILPRLRRLEEKINERLAPLFDEKLFVTFDNPVPEQRELLLEERTKYVGAGIMTINEARQGLGLDEVDGGDVPLVPFSVMPLGGSPVNEAVEIAEEAEKILRAKVA